MAAPAPMVRCELSNWASTGMVVDCGRDVLGLGKPVVGALSGRARGSRKTLMVLTLRQEEAGERKAEVRREDGAGETTEARELWGGMIVSCVHGWGDKIGGTGRIVCV